MQTSRIDCSASGGAGLATQAWATTINWIDTGGGPFSIVTNWNPLQIPADGDDAVFDLNNTYTVDFTQNVESDSVQLLDGRVTFSSSNATPPTYTLDPASSFSNALVVDGNSFSDRLSVSNVELLLDGNVRVTGGSTLSVSSGARLTPLNFGFAMVVGDSSDSGTASFSGSGDNAGGRPYHHWVNRSSGGSFV